MLKAPTLAGRRLMDEIEGLKLYLEVAEKHRLNLLNPPDRTPDHFEALLPYVVLSGRRLCAVANSLMYERLFIV